MITLPKPTRADADANINIVPYIDVMLVLLVIFMMTTPIIQQGVEIDLTTLDEDVLIEDLVGNDPVIISIDKNNYFYIGESKTPATLEQVIVEIEEEKKLNQDLKVLIRPDKTASIEKYVEIVTFIQRNTSIQQVGMIGK
ncbi:Tol biopolymer transport system, TolR protein [uncultured Gammaproteobacteria bacterium]|jgi:biopolymer transport protein TolR|nr:Tol biopolymer transport system, TolR protein [uncultured Gammaproteobacteria bacterium]VVH65085.1 Tol biopolymer transport system, TolR protein [uncultured Gammaproteobacteria bacterium]